MGLLRPMPITLWTLIEKRSMPFILQQSVQVLLEEVAREHGLDAEEMNSYRASSLREKKRPSASDARS